MVLSLALFDQLHEGSGGGVGDLWVGVQHLDDAVDQDEDGVLDLPVLLIQQLVTHLPTRKHMEVLEPVHAVHLRRLVRVLLA